MITKVRFCNSVYPRPYLFSYIFPSSQRNLWRMTGAPLHYDRRFRYVMEKRTLALVRAGVSSVRCNMN